MAEWRKGEFYSSLGPGNRVKIEADIYGGVAVHRCRNAEGIWGVASVNCGALICWIPDQKEARKVAETLGRKCCVALKEKTKEAIMAKFQPWVLLWAKECIDLKRWTDPVEFQERLLKEVKQ